MTTTYERIADLVAVQIADGTLAPGDLVPSTRRIVAEHGVAMATASRVLEELRRRGLVEARRGVGTVVTARPGVTALPRVTSADVVRAAIDLADAEGLAGLSMRRIAADVGLPTMSVYRHVSSRDELLARMLDAVYAAHPLPDPMPAGWRPRTETCARTLWVAFAAHPWAPHAMSLTRPQAVPHGMAYTEALLAGFADARPDLDVDSLMHLAVTVFQLVRGIAASIEPAEVARQDTGISDEDWMESAAPVMRAATDARRYPHLVEAMSVGIDLTLDSLFEFGLERLLDGIAVLLDAQATETGSGSLPLPATELR